MYRVYKSNGTYDKTIDIFSKKQSSELNDY